MKAEISKTFRFEAAHQLPNHNGKCARPHGHSYRAEVRYAGHVRGPDGTSSEGMVLDFAELSNFWRDAIHPMLDHQDLNQTIGDSIGPTTAENIAGWILHEFTRNKLPISSVTVWETATSSATVRA